MLATVNPNTRGAAAMDLGEPAAPLPALRTDPAWSVLTGDCATALAPLLRDASSPLVGAARLVFADPPYNLGLDYGNGHRDDRPVQEFRAWLLVRLALAARALAPDGSLFVLINDEHVAEVKVHLESGQFAFRDTPPLHLVQWIKWFEGFGTYNSAETRFSRSTRHLLWFSPDPRLRIRDPGRPELRRMSARQKAGDRRANPRGRLHPDTWDDISRLCGTFRERLPWSRTQLPRKLLARIIETSTDPGDLVLDPFQGTATTGVECLARGRRYLGVEQDPTRAILGALRLLTRDRR
ncbi:site-specific DNA-methyltransferase [Tautonia sp. JC769]|uniref:DNA-methyltransferase n=1 Tax=Tautonia sp. JC769 TaxID=3232135 RepID=UPI003459E9A3